MPSSVGLNGTQATPPSLGLNLDLQSYLKQADPTSRVGGCEMLVIVKMDVTEEPGVSKLPSGTVEPLRAPEVSTLVGENKAVIYCTSSSSDYLMI